MPKSKRGPLAVEKYFDVHESYMEHFRNDGIIERDTLEWDFSDNPAVTLSGKIFFSAASRLCLNVSKSLLITKRKSGKALIRTVKYSYNLNFDGEKESEIFRYDNFDAVPRDGHDSPHHCHRFDPPSREILNSPFELDEEEVPTLGEVIKEAHQYYLAHVLLKKPKK